MHLADTEQWWHLPTATGAGDCHYCHLRRGWIIPKSEEVTICAKTDNKYTSSFDGEFSLHDPIQYFLLKYKIILWKQNCSILVASVDEYELCVWVCVIKEERRAISTETMGKAMKTTFPKDRHFVNSHFKKRQNSPSHLKCHNLLCHT